MRLTKYEHAALVLEEEGRKLIVDPGSHTSPLPDVQGVAAVVITHEHPDHWTPAHLDRILEQNPGVPVLGPEGFANAAAGYEVIVVEPGDTVGIEPFELTFFGGRHEVIHSSIPVIDNVGVLVNGSFYYPGDSYSVPKGVDVDLLAAPVGAPWLRIADAMDFVLAVAPRRAFATHDMTLSTIGRESGRARLTWATEQGGGAFLTLDPGDSTEI